MEANVSGDGAAEAYVVDLATGQPVDVEKAGVAVEKASNQIESEAYEKAARKWLEPRHRATDLLLFFDVSTWHRRCILLKSTLACGLGYALEADRAGAAEGEGGEAARALLARCNDDGESIEDVGTRVLTDLQAVGYAGFEVVRNGLWKPVELYHVPARTLRVGRERGYFYQVRQGGTKSVRFAAYGSKRRSARTELVFLRQYDPLDDVYGTPEWLAALGAMALDRSAVEANIGFFKNGMVGVSALVVEGGKLGPEATDRVRRFLLDRAVGVENAGRLLVLQMEKDGARLRFEKLTVDQKDLGFVKGRESLRDEILSAHGVPPRMVGVVTAGALGSTNEVAGQLNQFRETGVRPLQRLLAKALRPVLDDVTGGGWGVRFAEMDITDPGADAQFFDKMIEREVYSPQEVRALLDRRGKATGGEDAKRSPVQP